MSHKVPQLLSLNPDRLLYTRELQADWTLINRMVHILKLKQHIIFEVPDWLLGPYLKDN